MRAFLPEARHHLKIVISRTPSNTWLMNNLKHRQCAWLKLLLPAYIIAAMISASASAGTWSFVVAGDGRTDPNSLFTSPDPTGINTRAFTNLLCAINQSSPRPEFMLFTGDLINGADPRIHDSVAQQLEAWKGLVSKWTPNLMVLPVRGNHETDGDTDGKAWLTAFRSDLDRNGLAYFPGEEGFSYCYFPPQHSNVVVIALDQYQPAHVHRVNLVALENALKRAKARHVDHIFVFAHEMAFTCAGHPDGENMAAFPKERDRFLELLESYGCKYFFAGHDHTYDWMVIRHSHWPTDYALNQIVAGTAGATFYPDLGYYGDHHGYVLERKEHQQSTCGYLLVTVDDSAKTNRVSVTFKAIQLK
jgi:hypothetical protein